MDNQNTKGFSLIELLIAMTVMLVLLGLTSTILMGALSIRSRESSKTDALSATQAALNVISREVANAGYGLSNNGLISSDSSDKRIRIRANLFNNNNCTTEEGEDVTYFFDVDTKSIVRSERRAQTPCGTDFVTKTSVVVNRISSITFQYFDYTSSNTGGSQTTTPTVDTGQVMITVEVELEDVPGQPPGQRVSLQSAVSLRNSKYMLSQY